VFFAPTRDHSDVRQCTIPLASVGREGFEVMITVDKIGQIRRAFFKAAFADQGDRADASGFSRDGAQGGPRDGDRARYERGVQPTPKLGEWVEVLTKILEKEAGLSRRERRSTQRSF
jgi:hypothetical protein